MSVMNGRVRLNGIRMGAGPVNTSLKPPPPQPEPMVNTFEAVGLIGGAGLLAGSTVVQGESRLLLALLGAASALLSGYSVVSKMTGGESLMPMPEVFIGPDGKPLVPGTPAYAAAQAASAQAKATRAAQAQGGGPLRPAAPAPRQTQGPANTFSSPQAITAIANPFAQLLAKQLAPSSSPAAAAARPPGSTASNPYGLVTESDLEKSMAPAPSNPYGIVTSIDSSGQPTPVPMPLPGIVTQINEDSSAASAPLPGMVTDYSQIESGGGSPMETMPDLAGIANGA